MNCPQCGWLNQPGLTFCINCGSRMGAATVTDTATPDTAMPGTTSPNGLAPAEPPAPDADLLGPLAAAGSVAPAGALPLPGLALPGLQRPAPSPPPPQPRAAPAAGGSREWMPVPGPIDRESFFSAQRRHRRATWRLTALCTLTAILTGIPISLIFTPFILTVIVLATWLVNKLVTVPAGVWDFYAASADPLVKVFNRLADDTGTAAAISAGDIALAALLWLAPGIIAMLLIWPLIRELFDNVGVGATLLALGAREPHPNDLEERQLVNVIEETAIAAGLPAPRVMLLDTYVANAAVVGSGPKDATIIVSRPLVDDLDRGETQGVLADLVASIGNGDLGIAQSIIAVFQTFGIVTAFLKAPVNGRARRTLWHMLRFALGRRSSPQRAANADRLTRDLTGGIANTDSDDFDSGLNPEHIVRPKRGPQLQWVMYLPPAAIGVLIYGTIKEWNPDLIRLAIYALIAVGILIVLYQWRYLVYGVGRTIVMARMMAMLPYYLAVMMPQMLLMIFSSFLLTPMIGRTWRNRRYLADATAVQLTRNPDWVADGLSALVKRGGVIPGGKWATPLFVVGPEAGGGRYNLTPTQAQAMARAQAKAMKAAMSGDMAGAQRVAAEVKAEYEASLTPEQRAAMAAEEAAEQTPGQNDEVFGVSGGIGGFHPSIGQRVQRLRKMGAGSERVDPERSFKAAMKASRRSSSKLGVLLVPLVFLLLGIAAVLMVVAVVLMTGLSLLFTSLFMLIPYGLLELLRPQ